MPTLYEIYLEDLRKRKAVEGVQGPMLDPNAPTPGGLNRMDPAALGGTPEPWAWKALMVGKGIAVNTPINIAKGLGHTVANIAQAVSPVPVPFATDEPIEGFEPLSRAKSLANAALFGIPHAVSEKVEQTYAAEGSPKNFEDRADAWLGAGVKTLLMDVLPGNEAKAILQGIHPATGQPLSAEEFGEMMAMGAVKLYPWKGVIGKGAGKLKGELGKMPLVLEKRQGVAGEIKSSGTIDYARKAREAGVDISDDAIDAADIAVQMDDYAKSEGKYVELPKDWGLTDAQLKHFEVQGMLEQKTLAPLVAEAYKSPVLEQVLTDLGNIRNNRAAAEVIRRGGLSPERIESLSRAYPEVPLAEISKTFAELVERTASIHGTGLRSFRQLSQATDELMLAAERGDKLALQQLDTLKAMRKPAPTTLWGRFVWFANRGVERIRRAAMVAQTATMMRNITVQGNTFNLQILEDAIAGTMEAMTSKFYKDTSTLAGNIPLGGWKRRTGESASKSVSSYYHDLRSDFVSLFNTFSPKRRKALQEMLTEIPEVKGKLYGEMSYEAEAQAQALSAWIHQGKVPRKPGQVVDVISDTLTAATRLQEREFRSLFFQTRLFGWMDRLGIKDLAAMRDILKTEQKSLPHEIQLAITDSLDHALKQTFAANPAKGTMFHHILDFYQKIPFSTALAPPFPRFMMNSLRWQMEHSPLQWVNLLTPEFKKAFIAGADGGFKTIQAQRTLSQAMSGMVNLNAAWTIRNSQVGGAKYYQIQTGKDEEGNPIVVDARSYQPFVSYLFLAEMIRSVGKNEPLNMTANELGDAVVGIRRLAEVPMFAAADIFRSLNSTDPDVVKNALKTPAGQYIASFFVPLVTVKDTFGGITDDEAMSFMRDVDEQELTGPARANIPGLAQTLPVRINPWTGQPYETEHPLMRQLAGVSPSTQTRFQQFVTAIPDVTISKLVGSHGSQAANAFVSEKIGETLTTKLDDGRIVGDVLMEYISNASPQMEKRRELLEEIFKSIRASAVGQAEREHPEVFIAREVKKQPPSQREQIKRLLIEKGLL